MILETDTARFIPAKLLPFAELTSRHFLVPVVAVNFDVNDFVTIQPMLKVVSIQHDLGRIPLTYRLELLIGRLVEGIQRPR